MLPHPLTSFQIQKFYQHESKFNCFYSRKNLVGIKDGLYVVHIDDYESIGNHWIVFYVNGNNRKASYDAKYFASFGVEHIPKEIKKFIEYINIF